MLFIEFDKAFIALIASAFYKELASSHMIEKAFFENKWLDAFFVNFVLFTRDRILTNETQSNCFILLSYLLIYIGCVKSYSAKFVRNHSLIRYFLHCDWLLPSTDLKGHSRLL